MNWVKILDWRNARSFSNFEKNVTASDRIGRVDMYRVRIPCVRKLSGKKFTKSSHERLTTSLLGRSLNNIIYIVRRPTVSDPLINL